MNRASYRLVQEQFTRQSLRDGRSFSFLPPLPSATGRARKRRLRVAQLEAAKSRASIAADKREKEQEQASESSPLYPPGRPWRVLWPHPHGNPDGVKTEKTSFRIPSLEQFRRAWALYMETWKYGLRGTPSPEELERIRREKVLQEAKMAQDASALVADADVDRLHNVKENAKKNLEVARESAQDVLESAKDATGIQSQDDLRRIASDMMKLATECLQQFMEGYRTGRDEEIDKMLHEYFQDDDNTKDVEDPTDTEPKRRRKPKRAQLRD